MRKMPIHREIGAQSHREKYEPPIVIKTEGTSNTPLNEPRAAADDSDYCRYIHNSSHLLRIDADLFSIGYDLFDDIFGFVFYDDFYARQHRKHQIGIFFHAFDHVRIDPILFSV